MKAGRLETIVYSKCSINLPEMGAFAMPYHNARQMLSSFNDIPRLYSTSTDWYRLVHRDTIVT
jgi:hypothetical protein